MIVRQAQLVDLNACCDMDKSYVTEHVWQMRSHETERSVEVRFDTVRLPRPMKVDYPRRSDEILPNWRQEECFLVAADDQDRAIGFLDMTVQAWHDVGWMRNLVVERLHRRQGVATDLLRTARQWALDNGLRKIMTEAQTKNYPAIRFVQKHGFVYCGYNDRYYANGDIAVFFCVTV